VKRDKRILQYTRLRRPCTAFICGVITLTALVGCSPDLRTIRGTLDGAARAVECDDGDALFRVLDGRARLALESISRDRRAAAQLIRADYPATDRAARLRELGDAARAADAADLFSVRCPHACRGKLGASLGAPLAQTQRGDEVEVRTARNGRLCLHRGSDGEWGLCWNVAALIAERARAAQELRQISGNAAVYRKRRELATALGKGLPCL
jgi:hypothetical protein